MKTYCIYVTKMAFVMGKEGHCWEQIFPEWQTNFSKGRHPGRSYSCGGSPLYAWG